MRPLGTIRVYCFMPRFVVWHCNEELLAHVGCITVVCFNCEVEMVCLMRRDVESASLDCGVVVNRGSWHCRMHCQLGRRVRRRRGWWLYRFQCRDGHWVIRRCIIIAFKECNDVRIAVTYTNQECHVRRNKPRLSLGFGNEGIVGALRCGMVEWT